MGFEDYIKKVKDLLPDNRYEKEPPKLFDGSDYKWRKWIVENRESGLTGGKAESYIRFPKRPFEEQEFAYKNTKKELQKTVKEMGKDYVWVKITEMYLPHPNSMKPSLDARIIIEYKPHSGDDQVLILHSSGPKILGLGGLLESIYNDDIEAAEHDTKLLVHKLTEYFGKSAGNVSKGKDIVLRAEGNINSLVTDGKGDSWWEEQYRANNNLGK